MKFFVLILIICALRACSSQANSTTSPSNDDSNDESIYSGKYPSHVVIMISKNFLVCEGVLFSKNHVLTAAGCVQKYKSSPQELKVVAGIISTENIESDKNAQIRKVINVTIHQEWYNSKQESGDIAILEVSRSFNINKYVNVSAYGIQLFANDSIRVVGYGDGENLISNKLRVPPTKECYYGGGASSNNTEKFCAKFNEDGYEEIFWKKSFAGAPILFDDADKDLAGVMSVNYNAITYIHYYAEWIVNSTNVNNTKINRVQPNPSNSSSSTSNSTSSNETTIVGTTSSPPMMTANSTQSSNENSTATPLPMTTANSTSTNSSSSDTTTVSPSSTTTANSTLPSNGNSTTSSPTATATSPSNSNTTTTPSNSTSSSNDTATTSSFPTTNNSTPASNNTDTSTTTPTPPPTTDDSDDESNNEDDDDSSEEE